MAWYCKIGLHCWHGLPNEKVVDPKCGPHDPRDDDQRSRTAEFERCCKCGLKREHIEWPNYSCYP